MTAYLSSSTISFSSGGVVWVAVRAGSYELKMSRFEYGIVGLSGGTAPTAAVRPTIYRYAGASVSGGSATTPMPLRQGAPVTTATARIGQPLTVTGTSSYLTVCNNHLNTAASLVTYEPVYDLTVSPGSAFVAQFGWQISGGGTADLQANVYYEELRLAWHY